MEESRVLSLVGAVAAISLLLASCLWALLDLEASLGFLHVDRKVAGISAVLALVVLSLIVAARDYEDKLRASTIALSLSVTALLIVAVGSQNLLAWVVAYELASIPLILYLFYSSQHQSRAAAYLLAFFTILSGVLSVTGVVLAYSETGSFSARVVGERGSVVAGYLVAAGLLAKLPVVLLHYWLIQVYSAVPPHVGVIACSLEGATMLFIVEIVGETLVIPAMRWEDEAPARLTLALAAIGLVSIAYSTLQGLYTESSRELLAYSSIAHANAILLVLLGLALAGEGSENYRLLSTLARYYVAGYMVSKSAWFLLTGVLEKASSGSSMEKLRGSLRSSRYTHLIGVAALLLILPSPPSLKFFSELLIIMATPSSTASSAVLAALLALSFATAASLTVRFIYVAWSESGGSGARAEGARYSLASISLLSLALTLGGLILLHATLGG